MIGQMDINTALPGFNDLGGSVTPIFLSMDHFLYQFSTFGDKNRENLSSKFFFLQNTPTNSGSILFSSSFICATVSNAS